MSAEGQTTPPRPATASSLGLCVVVALTLLGLGSGAVLFVFDPTRYSIYPICWFHALTGWNCPGCGATRAAYELLHGHPLRALRDNALFVLVLAGLALLGGAWLVQRFRHRPAAWNVPAGVWWALLAVTLLFTGLRNLPGFAWLAP